MPTAKSKFPSKKPLKRVLELSDLEQPKAAVLNTLTSASGKRTYDQAIMDCAEARCAPWTASRSNNAKNTGLSPILPGEAGHVRTVPMPQWLKAALTRGRRRQPDIGTAVSRHQ